MRPPTFYSKTIAFHAVICRAPNAQAYPHEPHVRKLRAWPEPGTAAGIEWFELGDTFGIKPEDSPRVFSKTVVRIMGSTS